MKKRIKLKNILKIILILIIILISIIFILRFINPTEIDDISPNIPCPEMEIYNPDVLYVIPNYDTYPISYYPKWCEHILSLDKTLALHGINHTYREFKYNSLSQEELNFGISEFEKCFSISPTEFKPPQLAISKENKKLIENNNLKRRTVMHQITHKVYHCNDSDIIPNKIINIF